MFSLVVWFGFYACVCVTKSFFCEWTLFEALYRWIWAKDHGKEVKEFSWRSKRLTTSYLDIMDTMMILPAAVDHVMPCRHRYENEFACCMQSGSYACRHDRITVWHPFFKYEDSWRRRVGDAGRDSALPPGRRPWVGAAAAFDWWGICLVVIVASCQPWLPDSRTLCTLRR